MPADNTLTFDQDPPHRADLTELGGGAKENDAIHKPDPVKHPTAEDFNQASKQLAAFNRVAPLALVWVRITAGTPAIYMVQALGANVVPTDFTPTDEGAGQTLITWTTGTGGKLPGAIGVKASQTDDVEIDRIRAILTTNGSDPAARVKTKLGLTGTDCNFCLEIY